MKRNLTLLFFILFVFGSILAQVNPNHVYVEGYTRSDGTYVESHYRTAPNATNRDNFSTKGNVNPYTGKPGWIEPDNKGLNHYQPHSNYNTTSSNYRLSNFEEIKLIVNRVSQVTIAQTSNTGEEMVLWRDNEGKKWIYYKDKSIDGYLGDEKAYVKGFFDLLYELIWNSYNYDLKHNITSEEFKVLLKNESVYGMKCETKNYMHTLMWHNIANP